MIVLLTIRTFNRKRIDLMIHQILSCFKSIINPSKLKIVIAIDSRGKMPFLQDHIYLSKKYSSLQICFHQGLKPGKSNAQSTFAMTINNTDEMVLLNDLDCDININSEKNFDDITSNKSDCIVFPVEFVNSNNQKSLYFGLENYLRKLEAYFGCCFTGSGQILITRIKVLRLLPDDVGDDCFLPLYSQLYCRGTNFSDYFIGCDSGFESYKKSKNGRSRMIIRNLPYTFYSMCVAFYKFRVLLFLFIFIHKIFRWIFSMIFPIIISLISIYYFKSYFILFLSCLLVSRKFHSILGAYFGLLNGFCSACLGTRITHY